MQNFKIDRFKGGYRVDDGQDVFVVTKPNGTMHCSCPHFAQSQSCRHIEELRQRYSAFRRMAEPAFDPKDLPPTLRTDRALMLQHPFRDDQILVRGQERKLDCNAVIQRLNDVFGAGDWTFEIVRNPIELPGELMIQGMLSVPARYAPTRKQDYGAARFSGSRPSSETFQAAVDDCLIRCARQLGVGLEFYSEGLSHHSFSTERLDERTGEILGPDNDDSQDRVGDSKA
jgi:hypothetical protein